MNLDIVDGSTIWLANYAKALAQQAEVFVFSRDGLSGGPIGADLQTQGNVLVVEPAELGPDLESISRSDIGELLSRWEDLQPLGLDALVVRGEVMISALASDHRWSARIVGYWPHADLARPTAPQGLRHLAEAGGRVICQSTDSKAYLETYGGVSASAIAIVPPLVNLAGIERQQRRPWSINFSGKVDPLYCVEDLLIASAALRYSVDICEAKVLRTADAGFSQRYERLLSTHPNVKRRRGLAHRDALLRMSSADIGFCVRKPSLNGTAEISTKLLEYIALGVPPLINRGRTSIELLGSDYPLMFDYDGSPATLAAFLKDLDEGAIAKARAGLVGRADKFLVAAQSPRLASLMPRARRSMVVATHEMKFLHRAIPALRSSGVMIRHEEWSTQQLLGESRKSEGTVWCEFACQTPFGIVGTRFRGKS